MSASTGWKPWLDPKTKPFMGGVGLGLVFALSWILAFPGVGIWPLVVVGPAALLRAAVRTDRPLRTALGAGLGSIPLWAWTHAFVIEISFLGYLPLVIHLAIFPSVFVWLAAWLRRSRPDMPLWILAPVVWIGIEVLRGEILWTGYPWFLVAHPLVPLGALADYASVIGAYGVGAIAMAVIGWVFDVVHWQPAKDEASAKRGKHLRVVGLVGALIFFLGAALLWPQLGEDRETIVVGVVQTNLAQSTKMRWPMEDRVRDLSRFLELTSLAAQSEIDGVERGHPDLIIWPETMYPGHFGLNSESVEAARAQGITVEGIQIAPMHDALVEHQASIGIPMIVGAIAEEGLRFVFDEATGELTKVERDAIYNSAFVIEGGQVQPERYDKTHLTPFGEVMPYISAWPWLERQLLALGADGMTFDLDVGQSKKPLTISLAERGPRKERDLHVAAPICFETTMSQVCRDLVYENGARRASLMVNLTNDGWFSWQDSGRGHHLLHARWRCIELGTPMIRAANTGISALIDARGRVIDRGVNLPERGAGVRSDGVLWGELRLPRPDHATIFARVGNAPGWGLLGALIVLTTMSFVKARSVRARRSGGPKAPPLRLVGTEAQADDDASDSPT